MKRVLALLLVTLIMASIAPLPALAQENEVKVRAILFYSPTCPHCHEVIQNTLPPLFNAHGGELDWYYFPTAETYAQETALSFVGQFGGQLNVLYVDVSTELGAELFFAAIDYLEYEEEGAPVPFLVVADQYLIGSGDIPAQLPGIIAAGLAADGIPWPAIEGLDDYLTQMIPVPSEALDDDGQAEPTEESPTGQATQPATEPTQAPIESPLSDIESSSQSWLDKVRQDPAGNTIAIVVLMGMSFAVIAVLAKLIMGVGGEEVKPLSMILPVLAVIGLIVAGYLTFVETSGAEPYCGPVGDCGTVQNSPYAMLFGFLHVGLLGVIGYVGILAAWAIGQYGGGKARLWARVALFGMAFFGTLFSIYLTFLEPFVIGATCMWCVTSAILITLLMWFSLDPATAAIDATGQD
jgi:uncharacterized membrane protein